jgi:EpsI family protein
MNMTPITTPTASMTRNQWRALWLAAVMLLGAALAYVGKPSRFLADQIGKPELQTLFPKQFGEWRIDTARALVMPAPDVQAKLDVIYNQLLSRTYVNSNGQRIMLSVAYGGDQSDGTSAHRPEACYPAQGFAITYNAKAAQSAAGGSLAVRQLMAQLSQRNEPITYWVVVGNEVATTGIEQKLAQMRYGLRGVIADGMLVRVSSIDADRVSGHKLQAAFIAELAAAIPAGARARVFGSLKP